MELPFAEREQGGVDPDELSEGAALDFFPDGGGHAAFRGEVVKHHDAAAFDQGQIEANVASHNVEGVSAIDKKQIGAGQTAWEQGGSLGRIRRDGHDLVLQMEPGEMQVEDFPLREGGAYSLQKVFIIGNFIGKRGNAGEGVDGVTARLGSLQGHAEDAGAVANPTADLDDGGVGRNLAGQPVKKRLFLQGGHRFVAEKPGDFLEGLPVERRKPLRHRGQLSGQLLLAFTQL